MALPQRINLKTGAGFTEQFRCHSQVRSGFLYAHMPEIGAEVRQETLHVFAFSIPGCQTGHRKRMAEIVKTRLKSGVVETQHTRLHPEPLKLMVRVIIRTAFPSRVRKNGVSGSCS